MSSMSGSAADRELGILLDNGKEELSGPTCTGDNSKYVSNQTGQRTRRHHSSVPICINVLYLLFKMIAQLSCFTPANLSCLRIVCSHI